MKLTTASAASFIAPAQQRYLCSIALFFCAGKVLYYRDINIPNEYCYQSAFNCTNIKVSQF